MLPPQAGGSGAKTLEALLIPQEIAKGVAFIRGALDDVKYSQEGPSICH